MLTKQELKCKLKSLGIAVQGNFIKKSDIQRVLAEAAEDASLSKEILKTAKNIISLEYDSETEQQLLDILENAYEMLLPEGAFADLNWQQNIRDNKQKQKRLQEMRKVNNLKIKKDMQHKGRNYDMAVDDDVDYDITPLAKKIKKDIEKDVKKIGNVLQVNFKKEHQKKDNERKKEAKRREYDDVAKREFRNRIDRIRTSLERINELMTELHKKSQDETQQARKPKLEVVN